MQKRSRWKGVVILLVTLVGGGVALFGSVYGYRSAFGAPAGGTCEDVNSCKPGNVCIGRRCYKSCSKDADCASGWHCGTTKVEVVRRGGYSLSEDKSDGEEQICFANKPKQ